MIGPRVICAVILAIAVYGLACLFIEDRLASYYSTRQDPDDDVM